MVCPLGENTAPHFALLGHDLCRMIIAEIVFCRICEYVNRVEVVWRESRHLTRGCHPIPSAIGMEMSLPTHGVASIYGNNFGEEGFMSAALGVLPSRKRIHTPVGP